MGDTVLGVTIKEALEGGSVCAAYRGITADGSAVILKLFDRTRPTAKAHVKAFRQGVLRYNKVSGLVPEALARLVCTATNGSGYVVEDYPNGSLVDLEGIDLSTDEKVKLFRLLLERVARLHAAGFVNRTLTPSNVLLDGLDPVVADPDLVDPRALSEQGTLGAKASFVAPEVIGGSAATPASEVFSLGRVLQFLLAGAIPTTSSEEKAAATRLATLDPKLQAAIRGATAQDPRSRTSSVAEFAEQIDDYRRVETAMGSSLKPGATSLPAPRSLKAPQKKASAADPSMFRRKPPVSRGGWLPRVAEFVVGGAGVAAFGGIVYALAAVEVSVEAADMLGVGAAVAAGIATWLAPRPSEQVAMLRLATAGFVGALIFNLDTSRLVVYRLRSALRAPDIAVRARAVEQLARLGERDFTGVDLSGLNLENAELNNVNMEQAKLVGANLRRAGLMESDLAGADLTRANLRGATLMGALFGSGVTGLETALCDRYTVLPGGVFCVDGHLSTQAPPPKNAGKPAEKPEPPAPEAPPPASASAPAPAPAPQ